MIDSIINVTRNRYCIIAIFSIIFTLSFQGYHDFLWSLILPLVSIFFASTLYSFYKDSGEKQFILFTFFWALLFRVIMVYAMSEILYHYNGMPFLSDKDDFVYNNAAINIMKRWQFMGFGFYEDLQFSSDSYSGFPNFSAALMSVFGTSHIVPRIGNAVLSSATVLISYLILKSFSDKEKARFTTSILITLPMTMVFAAMQFKDTLLLFFIIIGVYASVNIIQNRKILFSILLLMVALIGCSFGRPAVIVPIILALLVSLIFGFLSKSKSNTIIKVLAILVVFYLALNAYQILHSMGFVSMEEYFDSRFEILSEGDIQDTSANIRNTSIATYLGAPLYIILGLFLPAPLIVQIEDILRYDAWIVLAHYAFIPILIVSIWQSIINRNTSPTPFYIFLVYLFLRIGQANSILTSFSPRQSLATLYLMYLLIPMYKSNMKNWETAFICTSIFMIVLYNAVRLYSHGML